MSRPDSTLKKIIDQMVIELKKIKTLSGYKTNLLDASVLRKPHVWKTYNAFPCVYVYYSSGNEERYPGKHIMMMDKLRIVAKFRDDGVNDTLDQMSEFLTDLRYLLASNAHLTNSSGVPLVTTMGIDGIESDKGALAPLAVLVIDLAVTYHENF